MDRDETPVGGIEKPLLPTKELYRVSLLLDTLALLWSWWISWPMFFALLAYILASRAYSFRGIRLKKYPVVGYLTVCLFQGAVTYFMVYQACSSSKTLQVPAMALLGASLLMGSFYPLTQVYQHEADRKDGVKTISLLLGIRGTFQYTAIVYSIAMGVLFLYFREQQQEKLFLLMALLLLPVLVYFFYWANKVWKNPAAADFRHTMRMNWLASACSNLVFSLLILIRYFE